MGHCCRICGRERANEKFSGKGHASHVCKDCASEQRAEARRNKSAQKLKESLPDMSKQALKHTWTFRKYFRNNAFGWRGSSLAIQRLGEAVSEIKAVARTEPVTAAEGVVQICERIWPALQQIDTSSGALGTAVVKSLETLMPILSGSPADESLRRLWLDRLFEAVQEDGVEYLMVVQHHWAEICQVPSLMDYWADCTLSTLRLAWGNKNEHGYFSATDICLVCLLESGRYKELKDVLSLRDHKFWPYERYWAQALLRQGKLDEAIEYAESMVDERSVSYDYSIYRFCEQALIDAGRSDEAYERYALLDYPETTYVNRFRVVKKRYPEKDPRQILLDLINHSGNKGAWFASARQSGYLDIALDCALSGEVDVRTLTRAARDTAEKTPEFAQTVGLRGIQLMLRGHGWDITSADVQTAFDCLMVAARNAGNVAGAVDLLRRLLSDGSGSNQDGVRTVLVGLVRQFDVDRDYLPRTNGGDLTVSTLSP